MYKRQEQKEGTFKDTIPDPLNRYLWPEQLFDMQRGVNQLKRNEWRLLNLLIENPELTQKAVSYTHLGFWLHPGIRYMRQSGK